MYFCDNILWNIWTFAGPKSYFLDKLLIKLVEEKRSTFYKNPLRIYYQLWRIKKKHYNIEHDKFSIGRPSIYSEKTKHIDISNGQIGKIYSNNCIYLSENIKDLIIPLSEINEETNGFNMKLIYWKLRKSWSEDERLLFYISLWPDYRHLAPLETF